MAFVKLQLRRLGNGRQLKPDAVHFSPQSAGRSSRNGAHPALSHLGIAATRRPRPARDIVRGRTSRGLGFPC
jgi:hypothetical protein